MFQKYQRIGEIEARPYVKGDQATHEISISEADMKLPTLVGGMVARNPDNHNDMWYIAAAYFAKHYAIATSAPPSDADCICKGNWRAIVKEAEPMIGKEFRNTAGNTYRFFGVVHGEDDYYYGMADKNSVRLLSCVGSIDGHGYRAQEESDV
jgi:hypothetical protein